MMRRGAHGFSLIEAIAVMVILGVGTIAILANFQLGAHTLSLNIDSQVATQLAQERMEQVLADRRNPARGYAYLLPANYPDQTPVPGFANYNRFVSFTPGSAACPGGALCQDVRVWVTSGTATVADLTTMVVSY